MILELDVSTGMTIARLRIIKTHLHDVGRVSFNRELRVHNSAK